MGPCLSKGSSAGPEDQRSQPAAPPHSIAPAIPAPVFEIAASLTGVAFDVIANVLSASHAGSAAVGIVKVLVQLAASAGAASRDCEMLMAQVIRVMEVLCLAVKNGGLHELVERILVNDMLPILNDAQTCMSQWKNRGLVMKFLSGKDADAEFLELHQRLRDTVQTVTFGQVLLSGQPAAVQPANSPGRLPPLHNPAAQPPGQQQQQQSGWAAGLSPDNIVQRPNPAAYNAIRANKAAFDRLLLLYVLRYKNKQPGSQRQRSQQQRMLDLLFTYRTGPDFKDLSMEAKIDRMAKRLDTDTKELVPVLERIMQGLWDGGPMPAGTPRIEKWRMAIRLALQPLMEVTGQLMFPQTPEQGAELFED